MAARDPRQELLQFLDRKAFRPILDASAGGADQRALDDAQERTRRQRDRYRGYGSAEEIRERFLDDIHSPAAVQVNRELERLGLPRFADLRDEFEQLCDRLGVGPRPRPAA